MDRFEEIPLEQIEWQDPLREEISQKDVDDMAKSLVANGQIEPIVVEKVGVGKYRGIVGRVRFEGSKRAGRLSILARVHSFVDDSDRKAWQLVENLVRRNLNLLAVGEGYKKLREYYEQLVGGKYDKEIVKEMTKKVHESSGVAGPSERTIWRYMQFANDIPENVKKLLKSVPRTVLESVMLSSFFV
jgi:ParB/RepB/Spo0J family partition protein